MKFNPEEVKVEYVYNFTSKEVIAGYARSSIFHNTSVVANARKKVWDDHHVFIEELEFTAGGFRFISRDSSSLEVAFNEFNQYLKDNLK
ncbi:Hypothetical protein KNT65_gp168 [Escherichia phage EcS1]|uniref:Uncharacterized protein n=1 Tax=Escherichia phage EcS1 TaxID=2083276 RepID=A0A2Z5ZD13_9CAUD|nr:Hypothetical protein KNT65_gp168 [Escherichia phage EcS1]BBC78325.1 Hypothetical protein [Escherichia phage EcS1]